MAKGTRALFIDLLKGIALLVMIEVHVVNSFLLPSLRAAWWFPIVDFINGLVAPAFAFTSGMVFVISLHKGAEELRTFGTAFWRKMKRIGLLFFAGYSLHIPFFSFHKMLLYPTFSNMEGLFNVDILELIASGLLFLLFARIIIKTEKAFYNFTAICVIVILLLGPLVWSIDFYNYMPLLFSSYFNKIHGSFFPGFPWWAFVFSGAYVAKFYNSAKENNNDKQFAKQLIIIGSVLLFSGLFISNVFFNQFLKDVRPHITFFPERFGAVIILLGSFWFYMNKEENYKSLILDVSRESLVVYWFHLHLIYREFFNGKSLDNMYHDSLGIPACILITVIIIVLMLILAKLWGTVKKKYPVYARWWTIGFLVIGTAVFFYR
jgi:uncharacterized membrane protein